jgi:hypothetical protein
MDKERFRRAYEMYGKLLYRICVTHVGRADAEDELFDNIAVPDSHGELTALEAVSELPPKLKSVVVLHCCEGYTLEQMRSVSRRPQTFSVPDGPAELYRIGETMVYRLTMDDGTAGAIIFYLWAQDGLVYYLSHIDGSPNVFTHEEYIEIILSMIS